jgi:hypothetical protein
MPPKKQGKSYGNPPKPKKKRAYSVLNLSDKGKILALLKAACL